MSDSGSTPPADSAKPSSPSSGSLAFLVHSPDTVQRNLPPDVDNKPLARQKRRRTRYVFLLGVSVWRCPRGDASRHAAPASPDIDTSRAASRLCPEEFMLTTPRVHSPEDQKILEAEYSLNSKPDKMQRQKIVERVALGEKEVQVRNPALRRD